MASDGKRFIDFLKRVKYPDIDKLQPENFDYLFENEDMKRFLGVLCTHVSEDHILTPDEIDEYKSIQDEMNIDHSFAAKMKTAACFSASKEQTQKIVDELKENISHLEQDIKKLERQQATSKETKLDILKKQEEAEQSHKEYQEEIRFLQSDSLPAVIKEVKNVIAEGINTVDECYKVFTCIGLSDAGTKPLFLEDFEPYLKSERELFDRLLDCLNNDLQQLVTDVGCQSADPLVKDFIPELSSDALDEQQATELQTIQSTLQALQESRLKSDIEVAKLKREIEFYEDILSSGNSVKNLSPANLGNELEIAREMLQQTKKQEEELLAQLRNVIAQKTDVQCKYVVYLANEDKLEQREKYLELLEKHLDIVISQRARLDLLRIATAIQEEDFDKFKDKLSIFKEHMEKDAAAIESCLQQHNNSEVKDNQADVVEEGSLLAAIKNILEEVSEDGLHFLTNQDFVEGYKKLQRLNKEKVENSDELLNQQLKVIHLMETNVDVLSEQVDGSKKGNCLSSSLDRFNVNLGKFNALISQYQGELLKKMSIFQERKQIMRKADVLAKTRQLFVYALTNQEEFLKCIRDMERKSSSRT